MILCFSVSSLLLYFLIDRPIVITLSPVVIALFCPLRRYMYSYHSSIYCDPNSSHLFLLLNAKWKSKNKLLLSPLRTRKSNNYRYWNNRKSKSNRSTKERIKEIKRKRQQRWLITILENISHFGSTYTIFAECKNFISWCTFLQINELLFVL